MVLDSGGKLGSIHMCQTMAHKWIGSPAFAIHNSPVGPPSSRSISALTNAQINASRQVAGTSSMYAKHSSLSSNPPPGVSASAIARRPGYLALLSSFAFTHFTLAWALVPPVYLFLRQTNLSNSLLAGPQGAWLLSRKVPSWMPDVVVDGLAGAPPQNDHGRTDGQQLTVEQVLERIARRGIRIGWKYTKMGGSAIQTMRNRGQSGEDELADGAMRSLGAKDKGTAQITDGKTSGHLGGIKDSIFGYTRRQVRTAADDIQFGQIRDGIAAWVLVKVLFPIRLPISLWLTPKTARALMHAFGR